MRIWDWFRRKRTLRIEAVGTTREEWLDLMIDARNRGRYADQGAVMKPNHCRVKMSLMDRWIIVNAIDENLAWSGSRWVSIGGNVAVCNFGSIVEAVAYTEMNGLEIFVG